MKVETRLPLGNVDMVTPFSLREVPGAVQLLESLGYDGMTSAELQNDPFLPLAVAAASSDKLDLTTSVAIAFPRSPMVTAMMSWDIQRASGGRFILGMGTQVKGHIERRFGLKWTSPGPWLRDYILALRAIWHTWQTGEPLNYTSDHYNLTLMTPPFNPGPIENPNIPIHIAAVNAFNCQLAGELCDGIRVHSLNSRKYIEEAIIPNLRKGAEKAGRDLKGFEICAGVLVATAPDEERLAPVIEDVRTRIAFYASTRTYRPVLEVHGWADTVDELHQLSRQGKWKEMASLITDEMLHTFAVVGVHNEIADRLRERYGGIATRIHFGLPVETSEDREVLAGIIKELQKIPTFAG